MKIIGKHPKFYTDYKDKTVTKKGITYILKELLLDIVLCIIIRLH